MEYNLSGTSFSGGTVLSQGYTIGSNQGSVPISIDRENVFKYQLEREPFADTPYEFTVVIKSDSNSSETYASINWEEI